MYTLKMDGSEIVRCRIEMEPAGKEEARRTRLGHVYKPSATRERMNRIKDVIRSSYQGPLLDEPVALEIKTWRTRPKRLKKGHWYAPVKPDWDNIGKLISDCLENTVLVNDSRITCATVIKFFAAKNQSPGIEFAVSRMPAEVKYERKQSMTGDLFHRLGLKETMTLAELSQCLDVKERTIVTLVRQYEIPVLHGDTRNLEQE